MTDHFAPSSTTDEEALAPGVEGEQVVTTEASVSEVSPQPDAGVDSSTAAETEQVPDTELPAEASPEADVKPPAAPDAEAPAAEIDADEEEDEEEEEAGFDFFAPGDWYVVHTYAGYENKVKANLGSRIQSMNMEDKIYEVVVPTEEVMELKSGRMQSVQKKVFPGYILVRMDLDDDSWYVVRNTPGVTGFVGSGTKPTPLEPDEVNKILVPAEEERTAPKLAYEVGEVVSVIGGAFAGYSGPVETIDQEKQMVRVLLDLFGRETPVELTFDQVTKL
jgi:transcription termination/antitermination protein NusG